MKSSPKQPPAPDPYAVAGAQTASNVETAVANSWLGNANVNSPLGSSRTTQTGTKKVGNHNIPTFTQTIKLSPAQQQLLNQQNQLGSKMNTMAMSQADRLSQHLAGNADLASGLPNMRDGPQNISMDGLPELTGDMNEYRGQVESALMERMNPQLTRDYDDLENRLVNQGMVRGSEAFTRAMDEHGRKANDARTQIFLASGDESRAQMGEQRANRGQLFNERVTANNDTRANLESDIGRRNQLLQERLTSRNQPINEITALMGGGQVSMPQFSGYDGGQVEGTPVGQYMYKSNDIQQQQAQNAAESRANQFNNAAKISAGLFSWSDSRLKKEINFVHADPRGFGWYTFRYRGLMDDGKTHYGVMAQEVQDVLPEAVHFDTVAGYFYVDYGAL